MGSTTITIALPMNPRDPTRLHHGCTFILPPGVSSLELRSHEPDVLFVFMPRLDRWLVVSADISPNALRRAKKAATKRWNDTLESVKTTMIAWAKASHDKQ